MEKMLLTPLLNKLYNKCLIQEFFPDVFKVSQVIPIPKTAAPKELGDFRPISLLNIFAKIFKKILKDKIMEFIDNNNILSSNQYGFRANNSTELAVTTIYDEFLENLDRKLYTHAIFLDIKKAFDTIDHQILLEKLYHYGFRGKIWNISKSCLENRKICTKINQKTSSLCKIAYGIPQGSVLGPFLFLLYVNDLPNASKFKITLFADDVNFHLPHQQPEFLQKLVNEEIKIIDNWMKLNKLTLNYDKCKYMIVSGKPTDSSSFDLTINNVKIKRTESIRYLGVQLDEKLSWKFIENLKKKLSKTCGLIFKLRHYVPLSTCRIIYYSMFHSIILHSLINWGKASNFFIA